METTMLLVLLLGMRRLLTTLLWCNYVVDATCDSSSGHFADSKL